MVISDAKTPAEFQVEVVQVFEQTLKVQKNKLANAKRREAGRVQQTIYELQALQAFIKSIEFR